MSGFTAMLGGTPGGNIRKVLPKESAAGQVARNLDSSPSASGGRASYRSRKRFSQRAENGLLGVGYEPEEMK